jgi:3D (Asp-Asp-Asp) domain-containing protein
MQYHGISLTDGCVTLPRELKPPYISLKRCTRYNPVASQCQGNPLVTADGSYIDTVELRKGNLRWCALSRDMLSRWGGDFNYGDTIYIESESNPQINGHWVVHDCMNARYSKSIDLLMWVGSDRLGVVKDVKIVKNKKLKYENNN